MSFDITFLGSSGGPIEGSNCCILVKPKHISYDKIVKDEIRDEILCVDAGSGLSKLSEMIFNEVNGINSNNLLNMYHDSMSVQDYLKVPVIKPFLRFNKVSPFQCALEIFESIKYYLISHPHLDHVCSLVLNSPNFTVDNPKEIFGSCDTIHALNTHIFNGIIWPNMQEFDILKFNEIDYETSLSVNDKYDIKMFKLSHGKLQKNHRNNSISINENFKGIYKESHSVTYVSSAFLINYKRLNTSLLIFGDFESDSVSKLNFNEIIWKEAIPLILNRSLKAIVVECSSSNCVEKTLYGHLNPIYLIRELCKLKDMCKTQSNSLLNPLKGFHVIINHVKETNGAFDPRKAILSKLEEFNTQYNLEINFSISLSGVSISV